MGQYARQQPRAWHDGHTQLLKQRERVQLEPVLHDSALDETVELEAGERDFPVGRREPLEVAGVRAFEVDHLRHKVAFARALHHREPKVRETCDEARKKFGPCLGVQRGRLQARWGVGDEIGRTYVRLRGFVALIEDLDPASRGGLVAFYLGGVVRLAWRVGR